MRDSIKRPCTYHVEYIDTCHSPITLTYVPELQQCTEPNPVEFNWGHSYDTLSQVDITVTFPSTLGQIAENATPYHAPDSYGSSIEESGSELSDNSEVE